MYSGILLDAVDQHKALARGSSAESWIADSQFSYAYRDHKAFQKDRYAWDLKQAAGLVPDVLNGPDVQDAEPALGPAIQCLAILKGQGHILNPLGYITALAKAFGPTFAPGSPGANQAPANPMGPKRCKPQRHKSCKFC